MEPLDLVAHLPGVGLVLALAAGLCTLALLLAGAALVRERRVPAAAAASPVVLLWLAVGGLAWTGADPLAQVSRWAGVRSLAFWAGLAPIGLGLLLFAVVGARLGPRRVGPAAAGLVVALATAAVTVIGGLVEEDLVFPLLRGAIYAVFGALAAIALLDGGPAEGPGRAAGPAAAGLFVVLVGLGEGASQALVHLELVLHLSGQPPELREAFIALGRADVVDPMARWSVAAIASAGAIGLPAAWAALGRRPRRLGAALLGLVVASLCLATWRLGAPDDAALVGAAAIPEAAAAP